MIKAAWQYLVGRRGLTVTPQIVPCNGTGLERGAAIKGKIPTWHCSYYNCPWCHDDEPCDQVVFDFADGTSTGDLLITEDMMLWQRRNWSAPRGIVLTELVRSTPCSKGKHLYWRWRFMTDSELATLGPLDGS